MSLKKKHYLLFVFYLTHAVQMEFHTGHEAWLESVRAAAHSIDPARTGRDCYDTEAVAQLADQLLLARPVTTASKYYLTERDWEPCATCAATHDDRVCADCAVNLAYLMDIMNRQLKAYRKRPRH